MTAAIRIEHYQPRYREDFIRLNRQWIEAYFRIEASDLKTFAHVDDIVADGGQIFLAIDETDSVVGCCALIRHPEEDCHELAKMAVSPKAQGQHVGLQLGRALIAYAREHGVRRIGAPGFFRGNPHSPCMTA